MSFVFTETWDATFQGRPPDTENINLGAGRIRNLKVDIHERMAIDHQWAGNSYDGKHLQVQLPSIAAPALDGGDGCVFASSIAGITELFYKDSVGNIIQLTSAGGLPIQTPFPAGTRVAFSNVAPPPGWLQVMGIHDHVIRMVDDGTGQLGGGTWTISGITVGTSTSTTTDTLTSTGTITTTGTSVSITGGVSVDGHALTIAEMAAHTHNSDYPTFTGTLNSSGSNSSSLITGSTTRATSSTGSGNAHTHGVTNTLGASATSTSSSTSTSTSASTSTSFSTSSAAQDGNWRPAYLNFCLGQKT